MDNFNNIKVGDQVILVTSWSKKVVNVTRITKACFEVEGTTLYNKSDGSRRGGNVWSVNYCMLATDERIQEVADEKKLIELRHDVSTKLDSVRSRIRYLKIAELEKLNVVLTELQ